MSELLSHTLAKMLGLPRERGAVRSKTGLAARVGIALVIGLVAIGIAGGPDGPLLRATRALGDCVALLTCAGLLLLALFTIVWLDRRLVRSVTAARDATAMKDVLAWALEEVPVGVQIKDAERRFVWLNDEHGRRSRYPRDRLIGKTIEEVSPDAAFAAAVEAHDRRVLQSGKSDGPEEQVVTGPDGQISHVTHVTKIPFLRDGKVTHILTVSADMTDASEDRIRNEEVRRLLGTVFDAAPFTILVTDLEERIQWANRAVLAHFGWTGGSPIGRTLSEVMKFPDFLQHARAASREVEMTRRPVQYEHHIPAREGEPARHMLITKVPVLNLRNEVVQILSLSHEVTALRRAETEAETANRLVESILRNVPLSIQVKDRDLRFRWVNDAFAATVNQGTASLLGKTAGDLGLRPDVVERTRKQDQEVLATKQAIRFAVDWTVNGEPRKFVVIKGPITDAAGEATHVITIGADVSEVNQLRAAAEEARRRLQLVLDAVPVSIALKDRDRRYQWTNRAFNQSFGRSESELIGRRLEDLSSDPEYTARIAAIDNDILRNGTVPAPTSPREPSPDGTMRDYSVRRRPVYGADGQIEGVLLVGVDVTELQRATNELRRINSDLERHIAERAAELAKVNALVATVLESAPVTIVTYRRNGSIASWNPGATKLTGYTEAEALSGAIKPRTREVAAQFAALMRTALAGESFSNVEGRRHHKDGREIELLMSGGPLRGPDGTIEGMVSICLDVTELRATERQLRQAQRMEAVGQLTGGIAHDFNNLLAVVIGNLELLAEDLAHRPDSRALVNQATEAAERGASLTRRLLAFARQQTLRPVATDVDRLLANMEPLLLRAAGEAIVIERRAAPDAWQALVDPSQLESAILNLTVNARDAMPDGGKLTIDTRNATVGPGAGRADGLDTAAPGDYVCVSVTDTGTGIAPEIIGQVFEPFFTTKEVGKGSGLGLSMVFGFVKQSGGFVRIESEVGKGTCVSLSLPRVAGTAPEQATNAAIVGGTGETILVVEDNPHLRRTTTAVVKSLGYDVIVAEDGNAALRELGAHPEIGLLFTDVVLPNGMNGFELARRARERRPDLPLLFTSGFVELSEARASGLGPDLVILPKPFRRAQLAGLIQASLAGRGAMGGPKCPE